jgi:DNA repair photolyase
MAQQAILPIYPPPAPIGRAELATPPVRAKSEVEYRPITVGRVLNRNINPKLPFAWTINPYRGCEFACTYCYARYTHTFLDLVRWQDFERKVFFKRNAGEALARELRRRDLRGQTIAIGTATDPYQPAERQFEVTRATLEALRLAEGLDISITTKSPLILRDLELLTALDRSNSVEINVTMTTIDAGLARRLEQRAPSPQSRLRVVRKLASSGLQTRVFCMPLMPEINNGEAVLAPLLAAVRDAGAFDVTASPLFLRGISRERFTSWLRSEFPALETVYRRLYERRTYLTASERQRVMSDFRHLRLLYGFPRRRSGQG